MGYSIYPFPLHPFSSSSFILIQRSLILLRSYFHLIIIILYNLVQFSFAKPLVLVLVGKTSECSYKRSEKKRG